MSKRNRRSLMAVAMAYVVLAWTGSVSAAASGNYTDLLPVGAAGNTTVISNGSGWSLTTLAPSQTFGDALSRAPMTVYQSTAPGTIANTTTVSTFTATAVISSKVGSTTFPASWVATGRSIRVTTSGFVTTSTGTWNWSVLLGTTPIMTTGNLVVLGGQTNAAWRATALLTIGATGASGNVNGSYEILVSSNASLGTANTVSYSTFTTSAVSCDLTSQLTVNPTFKWGIATTGDSITANNVVVEFLN